MYFARLQEKLSKETFIASTECLHYHNSIGEDYPYFTIQGKWLYELTQELYLVGKIDLFFDGIFDRDSYLNKLQTNLQKSFAAELRFDDNLSANSLQTLEGRLGARIDTIKYVQAKMLLYFGDATYVPVSAPRLFAGASLYGPRTGAENYYLNSLVNPNHIAFAGALETAEEVERRLKEVEIKSKKQKLEKVKNDIQKIESQLEEMEIKKIHCMQKLDGLRLKQAELEQA